MRRSLNEHRILTGRRMGWGWKEWKEMQVYRIVEAKVHGKRCERCRNRVGIGWV